MRMIAIHAQTERKRLDRSVRCAEKRRPWARKQRLRGLIRPDPAVCATAGAACGRKSLSSARIQAIFTSNDTPLGECRLMGWLCSGFSPLSTLRDTLARTDGGDCCRGDDRQSYRKPAVDTGWKPAPGGHRSIRRSVLPHTTRAVRGGGRPDGTATLSFPVKSS